MDVSASSESLKAMMAACVGRRVVAFYPALAQVCGGVKAAVMLSQLLHWSGLPSVRQRGGWLYKSVEEMFAETGLTKAEQRTARHELAFRGLVEARLKGIPRTWFYRVDVERLRSALIGPDGQPLTYSPDREDWNAADLDAGPLGLEQVSPWDRGPADQKGDPADQKRDPVDQERDPADQGRDPVDQGRDPSDQEHDPVDQEHDPSDQEHDPGDQERDPADQGRDPGNENLPNVEPAGGPTRDESLTNIGAGDERPSRENRDNDGEESKPILSGNSAQLNRNQRLQQRLPQDICIAGATGNAGQAEAADAEIHTSGKRAEVFSKSGRPPEGFAGNDPNPMAHPAIALVKQVTGRYPLRPTFARVIAVLGDQPDEARFREIHQAWCMRGYNASNLEGQLGWYRDGIPTYVHGRKGQRDGKAQPKGPSLPPSTRTAEEVAEIRTRLREARERMEKRNQEETGG